MSELVPVGPDALFLWHGALARCCDYSNSPTCGTEKLKSVINLPRNKENNRNKDLRGFFWYFGAGGVSRTHDMRP